MSAALGIPRQILGHVLVAAHHGGRRFEDHIAALVSADASCRDNVSAETLVDRLHIHRSAEYVTGNDRAVIAKALLHLDHLDLVHAQVDVAQEMPLNESS